MFQQYYFSPMELIATAKLKIIEENNIATKLIQDSNTLLNNLILFSDEKQLMENNINRALKNYKNIFQNQGEFLKDRVSNEYINEAKQSQNFIKILEKNFNKLKQYNIDFNHKNVNHSIFQTNRSNILLPHDIISLILTFCDGPTLISCRLVSKDFKNCLDNLPVKSIKQRQLVFKLPPNNLFMYINLEKCPKEMTLIALLDLVKDENAKKLSVLNKAFNFFDKPTAINQPINLVSGTCCKII